MPPPWDECDWGRIVDLPRTDERVAEARRVVTVLLEDPDLARTCLSRRRPACCGT
ncbi:hypothetical protein [Amycolatopsis sp.]|uniref:hypothetical protein n=1 Tax=Amycolatopsis sp. TaxID=37632 RepID=UPI002CD433CB|nr:hypothetical protein [Amycolatopsis sp.]HVV14266.1 hypothetical protein [Amycolatopsis sp.]